MGPRVSRALRKAHTPTTQSSVFTGGMDHSASLSAPARRTRRIVIVGLAILGAAIAAFGPVDAVLKILSMPMREPVWHVWVGTFNGVALITVAVLPLAALAVWALARRRSATGATPAGVADVAGRGRHGLRDGAVGLDHHAAGRPGRPSRRVSLVPLRDLLTIRRRRGDGPDRRQPAGVRGAGVLRPAAVRGAGVGAADPGARGGLLGPGRGRAVRPAAGPGVLRGRRTAQRRRRRAGRAGVAPLVARYGHSVVRPASSGPAAAR